MTRPSDFFFQITSGSRERVTFSWSSKGNFLAVAGEGRKVSIYNRSGRMLTNFVLPPADTKEYGLAVVDMQWDSTGTKLAIIPRGLPCIILWTTAFMDSTQVISTDVRDLMFVTWDPTNSSLAAGSSKGHLIIYNEHEKRKVVYAGIHSKAITHGAWGPNGLIGLCGEDSVISVVKAADGSVVSQIVTPKRPTDVQFAAKKSDGPFGLEQPIMSAVVGNMLYVVDVENPSAIPLAFKFSGAYGTVKSYQWLSSTFVVVVFETGQIVGYSTTRSDQEIYSINAPSRITGIGFNTRTMQLSVICGRMLRVYQITQSECRELRDQSMDFDLSQTLDSVGWTADGQLLTVSTAMGDVLAYLMALPVVHGSCGARVAYLSQLTQVSVVNSHELSGSLEMGGEGKAVPILCDVEPEPENLALGPEHLAVSLNNKVWYYRIGEQPGVPAQLVSVRDFVGSVSQMAVNATHAAVLSNGRVIVHPMEAMQGGDNADVVLPLTIQQGTTVTCVSATEHFIIYGSSEGHLTHYTAGSKTVANEYRHARGIDRVFPNQSGSRVIFQDSNHQVFLFSPVADTLIPVPAVDTVILGCFWDQTDPSLFLLYDATHIKTYLYNPNAVTQPPLIQLATNPVPDTHVPLVLLDGKLVCQLRASPHLESLLLRTHHALGQRNSHELAPQELEQRFKQSIALRRFHVAADAAAVANVRGMWETLFQASLEGLEVGIAIRCARALGDAGMVMTLENIRHVEDRNLLAGHVTLLLHADADTAQDLFLRSSEPSAALRMRCDLRQWDEAMQLAQEMDPGQVGRISKELGQVLEMRNEFDGALQRYEVCMDQELKKLPEAQDAALMNACRAGMCRCLVRQGQVRRAMQIAYESNTPSICGECAVTLENQSHMAEAADMYLRAGRSEKAAEIYLAIKNYDAAGPLMAGIQSAKLQAMYARAKEAEGKWEEAIRAFEAAGESVQVIRILLERVKDHAKAFIVARRTKSVDGAMKCAQYCMNQGTDQFWPLAVEFMCLAGALEEALKEAINHASVDTWEKFAADRSPPELLVKAARYWEDQMKPAKAAHCYFKAQLYPQALRLYLRSGPEGVEKAVDVVEESKSRELGAEVLDFIMRSGADAPRYFKQMYKIQMALGRYDEAAATTIEIARNDQDNGNYRVAHQHLLEMTQLLGQQGRKVPLQLTQALQILHSYILVKTRVKLDDHTGAARLLSRVARSISRFPKHVVPILTSTVIECQRAGLNKTALDQAAVLMRPEYRQEINPNYKRKIEAMVRKPDRDARDPDEDLCPCPACKQLGPEYDLECGSCHAKIPMCIASGRRMVTEGKEWSQCPNCLLPCRASEMRKVLGDGGLCPCCSAAVDPDRIQPVSNPMASEQA